MEILGLLKHGIVLYEYIRGCCTWVRNDCIDSDDKYVVDVLLHRPYNVY